MTTTITSQIRAAIDRSRSHNEIVRIAIEGDQSDLMDALNELYDGEIDDASENDGTLDVWGWTEDMAEGEMDWRLNVRFAQ